MSSPYPNELPRNTAEFMRIGYNDACINFLVDFHRSDFDELEKSVLVAVKDGYNNFDAKKFVKAFTTIKDKLYKAKFGREGSPVFYAVLKHDATEQDVDAVKAAFSRKTIAVDELDEVGKHGNCRVIRAWWD